MPRAKHVLSEFEGTQNTPKYQKQKEILNLKFETNSNDQKIQSPKRAYFGFRSLVLSVSGFELRILDFDRGMIVVLAR